MAFGYALLKGCGGAAGYVRENGGQREVAARDLPLLARCDLYAAGERGYRHCGAQTADGSGNAKWTAPKEGKLFLSSGNKVLLWEGGDEAFLRACAWLSGQERREAEKGGPEMKTAPEEEKKEEELPAELMAACAVCAKEPPAGEESPAYPFERATPSLPERGQRKESPPERAYTLRPAGQGEPVDTLPERGNRFTD